MHEGVIFNIQRYSIHYGPGIRTIVFFKGCQLRCPWCSNPESQEHRVQIGFFANKCLSCGKCHDACSKSAINLEGPYRVNQDLCNSCGACVEVCAPESLVRFVQTYTVDELVHEVAKDWRFYRQSGGGVTVSGGEPSLQADFLEAFLAKCKLQGFHTAMEMHGHADWSVMQRIASYVDLFLFDVKHMDSKKHKEVTGVPNEAIQRNLTRLVNDLGKQVIIRIPVIPGFNDDLENIEATAELAKSLADSGNMEGVHLLAYHRYAEGKYNALDMPYKCVGIDPPPQEKMDELQNVFTRKGVKAQIGG